MRSSRLVRVAWFLVVLAALALMARGLWDGVYLEPTSEAVTRARTGHVWVLLAAGGLTLAAAWAVFGFGASNWAAAGVMAPVVVCAGLSVVAPESLLPVLSVLVAFPLALAGAVAAAVAPAGTRRR